MVEDIVRKFGHLTLGSRLKRIGERLQSETQQLMAANDITTPAAHFPILVALDQQGALSIGELSAALGVAQPGVTRTVDKLAARGAVASSTSSEDRRVRTVALTTMGQELVAHARQACWPAIEAAVVELCADEDRSLLARLDAIEQALDEKSLIHRAARDAENAQDE
ncbi:MAG: MarR family transcriptional regulator [Neomegalonema sp.]|nr:MarR family transcriptional regulator [Neomegalonema sp.]